MRSRIEMMFVDPEKPADVTDVEWNVKLAEFGDLTTRRVWAFSRAFGLTMRDTPEMPPIAPEDRLHLSAYADHLDVIAQQLRAHAARADAFGRTALKDALLRSQLHVEETSEMVRALARGDLVGLLDGLADISYVTAGTYLTYGLASYRDAAEAEVHASNMSKLGEDGRPIREPSGRVVKGPAYRVPNLRRVMEEGR